VSRGLEDQGVDIGLALAASLNGQEAISFQRLEVFADIGFVEAHVVGEPPLTREAIVILPCIAEQHREGELVAGAEVLRFEQEVRDLGEAAAGSGVGALEDDITLAPENVADWAHLGIFHRSHYRWAEARKRRLSPSL